MLIVDPGSELGISGFCHDLAHSTYDQRISEQLPRRTLRQQFCGSVVADGELSEDGLRALESGRGDRVDQDDSAGVESSGDGSGDHQ